MSCSVVEYENTGRVRGGVAREGLWRYNRVIRGKYVNIL